MKLSAVIFDLDGTVVEDEDEWGEAFGKILKGLGAKNIPTYPHIGGIGIEENWPILLKKFNIKTNKSPQDLAAETRREYNSLTKRVTLKKGFKNFVEDLKRAGIKTAIATSSTWDSVERIFDTLEMWGYFDSITTGEEVTNKKPDPQIFEIASEKLGVDPENILVFEDSPAGIEAAHLAGMKVIGVYRNKAHRKSLTKADKLVKDFTSITPKLIDKIA